MRTETVIHTWALTNEVARALGLPARLQPDLTDDGIADGTGMHGYLVFRDHAVGSDAISTSAGRVYLPDENVLTTGTEP